MNTRAQTDTGPPWVLGGLVVACACLALGAIVALEARHVSITHGYPLDWSILLISRTPNWVLLAVAMPFVLRLATKFPLAPVHANIVVLHVALFVAISGAHAALDVWANGILSPAVTHMFALGPRFLRSWFNTVPMVVTMYAAVLFAAWGMTEARERVRRTLRAAQLETQLQTARLAALRAQLQPHFLYNTLNGIAALVSDVQPARAVAAIEQLSELLHASLRDDGREEITIHEEIELAERYLALQRMRFGERLQYECQTTDDVGECLLPVLLLQPVVENAVVHGLDAGQELLNVRITASAIPEGVEILVENDGTALGTDNGRGSGHGVGLATTRARLMTTHGDRASLMLHARAEGGVTVRIVIPRKTAAPASRSIPGVLAEVT